jgi:hypothetical protein
VAAAAEVLPHAAALLGRRRLSSGGLQGGPVPPAALGHAHRRYPSGEGPPRSSAFLRARSGSGRGLDSQTLREAERLQLRRRARPPSPRWAKFTMRRPA